VVATTLEEGIGGDVVWAADRAKYVGEVRAELGVISQYLALS
jgi:hypothetical protein